MTRLLLALGLTVALLSGARAEDATPQYQNLLTPLLQGGVDVLGEPLTYPAGPLNITAATVTIPSGGETGWHSHHVPLFAYILEGELTVDYASKGIRIYKAGDSVLEAMNWPHNGRNLGSVPVRLLAVYMGGGDSTNTVKEPAP